MVTPPAAAASSDPATPPPSGPASGRCSAWWLYLAAGGVAAALYATLPGWRHKAPGFNLIGLSAVAAILVGIRLHRPARPLPWYLFVAGFAGFVVGDVFYYTVPAITHGQPAPFPSVGDAFDLLVYPLLTAGAVLLIRYRSPGKDGTSLIDALMVALSLGLLAWAFLIVPYARNQNLRLVPKAVSIAYPLMDVILVAVTARLAFSRGVRSPAFKLLFASMLCLLATDTAYGLIVLHGTYRAGNPLDAGWMAFYLLWGAAALHPSMRTLSERPASLPLGHGPGWEAGLTGWRLFLLGLATLMAPAALLSESALGYAPVVGVVGAFALVGLVVSRMAGLIHRYDASLSRERALREAGEALVAAQGRDEIFASAREALATLVGRPHTMYLFLVANSGEIESVHLRRRPGTRSVQVSRLPAAARAALGVRRWSTGSEIVDLAQHLGATWGGPVVSLFPVIVELKLRAFVVLRGERPLPVAVASSVSALMSQVVLALESDQLTEEIHRQRSEARFRSLVQNATDVVTVIDPNGAIVYQSPSIERVLGRPADDLLGTSLALLAHPDDRSRLLDLFGTTEGPAPHEAVEWRVLHADGSWRHFETIETNLLDDPNVGGFVLNSRDISDRKRAEAEKEMLQSCLRQAQQLEAIGQLAAGVAHDFNNLLAVITTYGAFVAKAVETLTRGAGNREETLARMASDVEKVGVAAGRAAEVTHQLLVFARRDEVEPKVLDVNCVVGDLRELVGPTIGEHIRLQTRLDGELWPVRVDPSGLYQVLMNLVINARDAMTSGGTLRIEARNVEVHVVEDGGPNLAAGDYVCLTVSDTGIGMTPEIAARAFEPLFTTKPSGEGSGLGLATVYGIVKQADGDVFIESDPGLGTLVKVYLPRSHEEVQDSLDEARREPASEGGQKILLVEDEGAVRDGTHRLLAEHGYRVLSAPNGAAAIRMARQSDDAIDLLLTDLVMPGMSGPELAQRLLGSRPETRVVYMSGYPHGLSGVGSRGPATFSLAKPFTEESLLRAIQEALASDRKEEAS